MHIDISDVCYQTIAEAAQEYRTKEEVEVLLEVLDRINERLLNPTGPSSYPEARLKIETKLASLEGP